MSRRHFHRPYHSTGKVLLQSQMLPPPSGRDPLKGRHIISHVSEPVPLSRRVIRSGLLRHLHPRHDCIDGWWQLVGLMHCRKIHSSLVLLLARDSMLSALYAIANPPVSQSVRLSVSLSDTRVDQSKTVERIIEILSPPDRPNILVFRHQRTLRKSDGFTPNGGAKYKGSSKN